MASIVCTPAVEAAWTALLGSATLKAAVIDTAELTNPPAATYGYLSEVDSAAIVATSGALTNVTVTGYKVDCDDIPVSAVTGAEVETVCIYIDTGNAANSLILCFCELTAAYTPTGADIVLVVDSDGLINAAA